MLHDQSVSIITRVARLGAQRAVGERSEQEASTRRLHGVMALELGAVLDSGEIDWISNLLASVGA